MGNRKIGLFTIGLNAILFLVVYLNWQGFIHFGFGIADIMIIALVIVVLTVFNICIYYSYKKSSVLFGKQHYIVVIGLLFLIYILLQMTVLRGSANPW